MKRVVPELGKYGLQFSGPLRFVANKLRDRHFWQSAEWFYRGYLRFNPRSSTYWTQLGDCQKELDKYGDAIASYNRAIDTDNSEVALAKLATLRSQIVAKNSEQPIFRPRFQLYLDITDILIYFRVSTDINGIQRVVINIIKTILSDGNYSHSDIVFCYLDKHQDALFEIDRSRLEDIIFTIKGQHWSRFAIFPKIWACQARARPITLQALDIFIICGAFWISPPYEALLQRLKQNGVRTALLVYDLIPLTHPQFVNARSAHVFRVKAMNILSLCDFALCISEFVAKEVQAILLAEHGRNIPTLAVQLADELPKFPSKSFAALTGLAGVASFALCVSALDLRKNHLYLIKVWQILIEKFGARVPTLVLVGRWGWRSEALRGVLKNTRNLDGKVVILNNIADWQLSQLYQNCAFSIFPSLVEGWGLPIGESLSHGRPCFTSESSSMPEVGGRFARYFDPTNPANGAEVIGEYIGEPEKLALWSAQIAEAYQPRLWSQVSNDLIDKAVALANSTQVINGTCCLLPLVQSIPLGNSRVSRSMFMPERNGVPLVCHHGWVSVTGKGPFAQKRSPVLRFVAAGIAAGVPLQLAMRLCVPPDCKPISVRFSNQEGCKQVEIAPGPSKWLMIDVCSDASGVVEVAMRIKLFEDMRQMPQPYTLGLEELFLSVRDDMEQRFLMLEATCV